MKTILVGTDTSAAADLAVEDAARLARERGAELLVLYVQPESDLRAVVDPDRAADPERVPRADHATRFPGVTTRTRVEQGDPAERICDVAADEVRRHDRGGQPRRARRTVARARQRAEPGPAPRAVLVFIVDTRRAQ